MKLYSLLFGVRFFTAVALGAFVSVVFFVDPDASGALGIVFFFASLFASLLGILSLALIALMRRMLGDESAAISVGGTFRQAALLSGFFAALLALSHFRMLVWWMVALLFVLILLLELTVRMISNNKE